MGDEFVIHQHHARRLHWDLRLEHDGVLASWSVPRGIPRDPRRNHRAIHTPDHPLEFKSFSGEIPAGQYGAGRITIYDRGTYTARKWRDDEVVIELHGERVSGRYALFQTDGDDWMMHRMDPPEAGWTPMPADVRPMRAAPAKRLPADDAAWAFELDWPGERALTGVSGGRVELRSGSPAGSLRALAEALAPTECLLDGVVMGFTDSTQYLVFDLLWLDGVATMDLPYAQRRELLLGLDVNGPYWQTPPHFTGGGRFAVDAAREQGLPGVVAKRLESPYTPGAGSRDWREIPA